MYLLILKDIKATHNAIEAPFQILLKLTMMAFGILPMPGTEKTTVKNRFDIEIDLTWFPIISTCLSIVGVLLGTLWIAEPVEKTTNWIVGKLTFVPIFFYRMLVWLIIFIMLDWFSLLALACFALVNASILFFAQNEFDDIDPIIHALLSLIFPINKLPSYETDSEILMKILFLMTVMGNSMLFIFHVSVYCLYNNNVYNPWSSGHTSKLLIEEEIFKSINPLIIALYISATLPTFLCYVLQCQR